MQTNLTKNVRLDLEPGDLLRFFRVLDYVNNVLPDGKDLVENIAKADAALLLNELREIHDIIKASEAPKFIEVVLNVSAEYERRSDSMTFGDIIVPGEKLPLTENVYEAAPPLTTEG